MRHPIAVLTGDIIASQKISETTALYRVLDDTLARLANHHGGRFERYRGDGFQLAIPSTGEALHAAVALRAELIMHSQDQRWDARVAVAIGNDDWQPDSPLASAVGPVFIASGKALDAISKSDAHLALTEAGTPSDTAMALLVRFMDELIDGWSHYSAEIAFLKLWHDESQQALAERLGIRQPSVHKRLRAARWAMLMDTLAFFQQRLTTEQPDR